MLLIVQFAPSLTLLALATYLVITSAAFLALKLNSATTINSLGTSWANAPLLSALLPIVLLSLGGLPPLTGFLPKWLILQELTKQGLPMVATVAALTALLSLYFYLRLSYAITLTVSPNNLAGAASWRLYPTQVVAPVAVATAASALLLPLAPALTSFLSL